MQLIATTDKIEILLGANVTTNQLQFVVSYNDITSTAVTPAKTVSVTNNTTAVDLVPAPSSGVSRKVKWISVFNSDGAASTVTIRGNYNGTTRNIFTTTLQVNEYIQYTSQVGWKVFDMNGALKITNNDMVVNNPIIPPFSLSTNTSTNYSLATTQCVYLGKATNNHKNITLAVFTGVGAATVTWSEAAIYKGTPTLGSAATLTRCGFVNTSPISQTGTGAKGIHILTTNINTGDDLWAVFGNVASTNLSLRANNVPDTIGAGFVLTAGTSRPSLSGSLSPIISTTSTPVRLTWMGD